MGSILKYFWFIIIFLLLLNSCDEPVVKKPKKLVSRDRMIHMLTDIHIAESVNQTTRYTGEYIRNFSDADLYYSILKKYNVADTTFEQSLIYYASVPKEYEKIYVRVLNRLNEMDQQYTQTGLQPVDITPEKR